MATMVETFGMTGMLVLAFLVLVAAYILLRLLGFPGREADDEEEGAGVKPAGPQEQKPAELSDEEFLDAYTGPILEDAGEMLESAVESVRSGLHFYDNGLWAEASGEFHSAAGKLDEAADKFGEVPGLVEDQGLQLVVGAKARMDECLKLGALAIRMEEASDAMAAGKEDEAWNKAVVKNELERIVSSFTA